MHLPNELLNAHTAAGLGAAAASVLGVAVVKVRQAVTQLGLAPAFAGAGNVAKSISGRAKRVLSGVGHDYLMKMAGVTSLVFAAQMFNFPISSGTSGHLLGGVLAAMLLGPWGAALSLATVLTVQAFMFGDGGLMVLGANIFNMSVVGAIGGYGVYQLVKRMIPVQLVAIAVAAWASLVMAAIACALEIGASGSFDWASTLMAMVSVHAVIGIGESLITLGLLMFSVKYLGWELYGEEQ